MTQEYVSWSVCPKCKNKVGSGDARFGPPEIRCGKCGEVLSTHLTEWANLSSGEKTRIILMQIVNPLDCHNVFAWFIYTVLGAFIFTIPVFVILGLLRLWPANEEMLAAFIPIGWLIMECVLLYTRLVSPIRESEVYTRTKEPPVRGSPRREAK